MTAGRHSHLHFTLAQNENENHINAVRPNLGGWFRNNLYKTCTLTASRRQSLGTCHQLRSASDHLDGAIRTCRNHHLCRPLCKNREQESISSSPVGIDLVGTTSCISCVDIHCSCIHYGIHELTIACSLFQIAAHGNLKKERHTLEARNDEDHSNTLRSGLSAGRVCG